MRGRGDPPHQLNLVGAGPAGSVRVMRTSGRRRFDSVVLGIGAVVTGGVAAIGGVAGDTERITGMWVGASLNDQGGAAIIEVIDYDFGLAQGKHGIFRTIPGLSTDDPVTVDSASAPDGIAGKTTELIDGERGIRLKIGDPNTTITGRHRYEIDYDASRSGRRRSPRLGRRRHRLDGDRQRRPRCTSSRRGASAGSVARRVARARRAAAS